MLGHLIRISSDYLPSIVAIGVIVSLGIIVFIILKNVYNDGYKVGFSSGREAERQRIASLPKPEPEREVVYVARKPLTAEQLEACKAAGGKVCPRCTEDEDVTFGEIDSEGPDEDGELGQQVECESCGEKWCLVFKVDRVEVVED